VPLRKKLLVFSPNICYNAVMKKIKALKFAVLFVTAIWGFALGIFGPAAMLSGEESALKKSFYAAWLVIAVIGFITPCFLVMLKLYRTAAALSGAGAIALLILYSQSAGRGAPLYLPLLTETVAVVLICILTRDKKKKSDKDAPAPSILGGVYRNKRGN